MVYLFYGNKYQETYNRAYKLGISLNKNIIIINENIIDYNKDNISLFVSFLSISADKENPCVILIENAEKIKTLVIQSFLSVFENLSEFHTVILATSMISLLPKTIISRSILFNCQVKDFLYEDFFNELVKWDMISDFELILNQYEINEQNTEEISLLLHEKYPQKKDELYFLLKNKVQFIVGWHKQYWKMIYLVLKS